ncbi:glycosyltransferase [Winogradskyella forsetii]|uniref:glycosyltransferase n=1 Tax=Winogradskyella forsetii TaxID=2686077 RepID=UPI0015BDC41F|nr:glycosyltransferase [Winogradskyella forsetii]
MVVFTVVVTHDRVKLLKRALKSIHNQVRKPNFVIVVSNSQQKNHLTEQQICEAYNVIWIKNERTNNYSGALNTGIEYFISNNDIVDTVYFSSLDDDDEWHIDYLDAVTSNTTNEDIVFANLIRQDSNIASLLKLPKQLDFHNFLYGNPGVGGSNTFVRLKTLLRAGGFDEAMVATVDRDVFVRLFQLKPTYRVLENHLVTLHVENTRQRLTNNFELKKESYRYFYYKYQHIMTSLDKQRFFSRAKRVFEFEEKDIVVSNINQQLGNRQDILFNDHKDFDFIVGFIAGDKKIAERIIDSIIQKTIRVDKLLIIDNLSFLDGFDDVKKKLVKSKIDFVIVHKADWETNLKLGYYGTYFKKFNKINSIPIGRTILQHHLFTESISFKNPVYWVIDDDITFSNTHGNNKGSKTDLFSIINNYKDDYDALIGSVSKDPPLPFLSSIRVQLVDLVYSLYSNNQEELDFNNLKELKDYYYDISDSHFTHVESPIYYGSNIEKDIVYIFSGKSVSRPVLQKKEINHSEVVSNRGPNTLIFNRDLLRFYPVVNLEVNDKFVRRGDLFWALLNQSVSNRKIAEHTFCVDQNRPIQNFRIEHELDKSANDIIGYAFNKAIIKTIDEIKQNTKPNRPKDIYERLNEAGFFNVFLVEYKKTIIKRKSRFLMNYYRIAGLLEILGKDYNFIGAYANQFTDLVLKKYFIDIIEVSKNEILLKQFIESLATTVWSYTDSIKRNIETTDSNKQKIKEAFELDTDLVLLGDGSEGIVFTDYTFVYKSFYSIKDYEWELLKNNKCVFSKCTLLESLELVENTNGNYIKYPYHPFKSMDYVEEDQLIYFLRFCKNNGLIFSNIKPVNFIVINDKDLKLIDYGRSFEPYTERKYINMIKRAFLMLNYPKMLDLEFRSLTAKINLGEIPLEIKGWENFMTKVINHKENKEIINSKELVK